MLATDTKSGTLQKLADFFDDISFSIWRRFGYTWALIAQQPTVKTSEKRNSYKVLGAIGYQTRFIINGIEGKLNSDSYFDFFTQLLKHTWGHITAIHDGALYH